MKNTHLFHLNIGGRPAAAKGFIHIAPPVDAGCLNDPRNGLPFAPSSIQGIYCENYLQTLDHGEVLAHLRECRRILVPGGTLRIATSDLDAIVEAYTSDSWRLSGQANAGHQWYTTRAGFLNSHYGEGGCKWLVNREEIMHLGNLAGFVLPVASRGDESRDPLLGKLAPATDSTLLIEFSKREECISESPLISVVIPAFKPSFFRDSLLSATRQTYQNIEILVLDDSPGKLIEETTREIAAGDSRVKYIKNSPPLGEIENLSKGIALASGEFIKPLYDDDVIYPGAIDTLLSLFREVPDAGLAAGRRIFIDANSMELEERPPTSPLYESSGRISGTKVIAQIAEAGMNLIGEPTVILFRKRDALTIDEPNVMSLFGKECMGIGDLALFAHLLSMGDLAYTRNTISQFRLHPDQTQRRADVVKHVPVIWAYFRECIVRLGFCRRLVTSAAARPPLIETSSRPIDTTTQNSTGEYFQGVNLSSADYHAWSAEHTPDAAALEQLRREAATHPGTNNVKLHILIDVRSAAAKLDRTLKSLAQQVLAPRSLLLLSAPATAPSLPPGLPDSVILESIDALATRLKADHASHSDWVLTLQAGDTLAPEALCLIAKTLDEAEGTGAPALLYCDHDEIASDGTYINPHFKPDANPDLLRSYPYPGRALVVRGDWLAAQPVVAPLDLCNAYELALRAIESGGPEALAHVPQVLAHLDPRVPAVWAGSPAEADALAQVLHAHAVRCMPGAEIITGPAPGTFHFLPPLTATPLVSIIVPTKDMLPLLQRCLESVLGKTAYPNYEIIVVDNASVTREARHYLGGLEAIAPGRIRVLRHPGPFNFSRINNLAAEQARGEYLLLLNNDTQVLHPDWLTHMLRHALRPEVGVVGAALFYPSGQIQHAGVILGLRGPAEHPLNGMQPGASGYLYRAQLTQNFSAVTAACMLVRASLYRELGGLDEQTFGVSYNDIDFCLRVRELGKLNVWTPLAMLMHEANASQSSDVDKTPEAQRVGRFTRELAAMRERWGHLIARDPAYNPNLSRTGEAYTLDATATPDARASARREMAGAAPMQGPLDGEFSDYSYWLAQRCPTRTDVTALHALVDTWTAPPSMHLLLRVEPEHFALLGHTLASLAHQLYGNWRVDVVSTAEQPASVMTTAQLGWHRIAAASEARLALDLIVTTHQHDWVCELPAGAVLDPLCLFRIAHAAIAPTATDTPALAWYCDDDLIDINGARHNPRLKPALDIEWLRCADLLGPVFVSAPAWHTAGGASTDATRPWYDLTLRVVDTAGPESISHIAEPLLSLPASLPLEPHAEKCMAAVRRSLTRRKCKGKVVKASDSAWRIDYASPTPPVTVAIPCRDKPEYLAECVNLILTQTTYPDYEIVVVDGGSRENETLALFERLQQRREAPVRIARTEAPFNLASFANTAAAHAQGEFLLLLADDVRVLRADWINVLVRHGTREETGCVGPILLKPPAGRIDHAGYVLGLGGFASSPQQGEVLADTPGHLDALTVQRSVPALSAACMLVRVADFRSVAGVDSATEVASYADIDFCLRLGARGKHHVVASELQLVRLGASSLEPEFNSAIEIAEIRLATLRAQEIMFQRWFDHFASDRYCSRHLDRGSCTPKLEMRGMPSWHAIPYAGPRFMAFPVTSAQGLIRVTQPLMALRRAGKAHTCVFQWDAETREIPAVQDLARHAPDAIVAHQLLGPSSVTALHQWRTFLKNTFLVYQLDDLFTDMPGMSSLRGGVPADARSYLARALRDCDRLVVSTDYLAEAYRDYIADIRVVPNRLERDVWLPHQSRRRTTPKPRVGWAGGTAHAGDLRLIIDVVAATAKEVDWVFMGMCPDQVRPCVKEFHPFTSYDEYPARLAALNLDLAVAPLEEIPFNRGKSNLRLLEYGALAIPVVCTDIDPYRNSPACRVANQPRAWVDALRERIHDLDAAAREGDAMRQWVVEHYILEDHLDDWMHAHLPG